MRASMVCEVIVDLHAPDVDRIFHYSVPTSLAGRIALGHRVLVPFGHARGSKDTSSALCDAKRAKAAEGCASRLDEEPLLSGAQIEVARWMRERYLCPLVQALQCFLPPGPA